MYFAIISPHLLYGKIIALFSLEMNLGEEKEGKWRK